MSTVMALSAFSWACCTLVSVRARNYYMTTSMEATFVFCAMFLYYMNVNPSLAALPLPMPMQSSTK